jgi:hypothetical protein
VDTLQRTGTDASGVVRVAYRHRTSAVVAGEASTFGAEVVIVGGGRSPRARFGSGALRAWRSPRPVLPLVLVGSMGGISPMP